MQTMKNNTMDGGKKRGAGGMDGGKQEALVYFREQTKYDEWGCNIYNHTLILSAQSYATFYIEENLSLLHIFELKQETSYI